MTNSNLPMIRPVKLSWNKGRIIGQKRALQPRHVWAIRVRLEIAEQHRDLTLLNVAVDSKLRGCDLVRLKVEDISAAGHIKERASVLQSKTKRPVQFEITNHTCLFGSLAGLRRDEVVQVSLAQSAPRLPSHLNPPICSIAKRLGAVDWP